MASRFSTRCGLICEGRRPPFLGAVVCRRPPRTAKVAAPRAYIDRIGQNPGVRHAPIKRFGQRGKPSLASQEFHLLWNAGTQASGR
jgi:hypothetical protein